MNIRIKKIFYLKKSSYIHPCNIHHGYTVCIINVEKNEVRTLIFCANEYKNLIMIFVLKVSSYASGKLITWH